MGTATKIQWTDHTWNPWRGCSHATLPDGSTHPGCLKCYAEAMARRNPGTLGVWGEDGMRIRAVYKTFNAPLKWDKAAKEAGEIRRVFVDSLSDFFEDWRGPIHNHLGQQLWKLSSGGVVAAESNIYSGNSPVTMDDLRRYAFAIMRRCTNLVFMILTKRPQNIQRMVPCPADTDGDGDCATCSRGGMHSYPNIWPLVSVSDQVSANAMIPPLLRVNALFPVMGVSAEPLIGPVDFTQIVADRETTIDALRGIYTMRCDEGVDHPAAEQEFDGGPRLRLVIPGGESGPRSRPCNVDWIRSIRDQCKAAGVACFIKQLGSKPTGMFHPPRSGPQGGGGSLAPIWSGVRDPKGGDWSEWPEDLRVREFPQAV